MTINPADYLVSATQIDKLAISRALDTPYLDLLESRDFVMVTAAIIKARHENTGHSIDTILGWTDPEVFDFLGIDPAATEAPVESRLGESSPQSPTKKRPSVSPQESPPASTTN